MSSSEHYERVLSALKGKKTDRVPFSLWGHTYAKYGGVTDMEASRDPEKMLKAHLALQKRTGERDHPRHIMRHGFVRDRHRSPQTQSTRPNPLTNPTPPDIHAEANTATASRAMCLLPRT